MSDPAAVMGNPLLKYNFLFIEQRRLTAKILTNLIAGFEAL